MLAEGLHSAADGVNTALLLVGVKLSRLSADARHRLGDGAETYFWSVAR